MEKPGPFDITGTIGGTAPFSMPTGDVLHYMAATGCSDSNNGTSPSTPWCSPNHAMHCGDVIIAAPGSYTNNFSTWGTVTNCPSSSGGIDGSGGIYAAVVLCGGADLANSATTSCVINCASAPCHGGSTLSTRSGMGLNKNYWAVEGWVINGNGLNNYSAYMTAGCANGVTHHIAIVNTVVWNGGQAYFPSDCNNAHDARSGADYVAVVGMIAQNSNFDTSFGICVAAVDLVSPGVYGTATDVHSYWSDIVTYNDIDTGCDGLFDGEAFMYDTVDNHPPITNSRMIIRNSIGYYAERYCMNWNSQQQNTNSPIMKFYNNTCYDNVQRDTTRSSTLGELMTICTRGCSIPWQIQIFNNIVYAPHATAGQTGGPAVYAWMTEGVSTTVSSGTQVRSGAQNIYKGSATTCTYNCDPGDNVVCTTSTRGCTGSPDTYINPNFANAADLISNRLGVPNCAGFVNTTQCLGWNASTQTLTSPSIIADLSPNCSGLPNNGNAQWCGGKGYQPPSTACVTSGDLYTDYPVWLKGLVYLHWTGSAVVQMHDLATTPCGL